MAISTNLSILNRLEPSGSALLAISICLRPDIGLALVAFSIPFYLYPKHILGMALSTVEILILLCFGILLTDRVPDEYRVMLARQYEIELRHGAGEDVRALPALVWCRTDRSRREYDRIDITLMFGLGIGLVEVGVSRTLSGQAFPAGNTWSVGLSQAIRLVSPS